MTKMSSVRKDSQFNIHNHLYIEILKQLDRIGKSRMKLPVSYFQLAAQVD